MIRTMRDAFASFPKLKSHSKILLLTHTDLDGEGAAILFKFILGHDNVDVIRCKNATMSFDIAQTLSNEELMRKYNMVFATDISCNEKTAKYLNYTPCIDKFVLLDHHASASYLDKYPWACIQPEVFLDSYRYDSYQSYPDYTGHSCGTSLAYDYLEYCGLLTSFSTTTIQLIQQFVHMVVRWDTWEWVHLHNSQPEYNQLRLLYDTYGFETFSNRILQKLCHTASDVPTSMMDILIDDTDRFVLSFTEQTIQNAIKDMKHRVRTGTLRIPYHKEYSVVYLCTNQYINEAFDMMKENYPNQDLYICNYGSGLSFRTMTDIDLSIFLSEFGGGGHPDAAGLQIPMEKRLELVSDLFHGEFRLNDCH